MCKMTKKAMSVQYVSKFQSIFQCPICTSTMSVMNQQRLVCENNHSFDFAKQGYLNLLTNPSKSKYDKVLFEARRKLMNEGAFFEPVCQAIAEVVIQHFKSKKGPISILDIGCGEGTHLAGICNKVGSSMKQPIVGTGMDISKEGILVAAKHYSNKIWCVADLANSPFRENQFDAILPILSPSNYAEFNRLLKKDGLILKVVPQSGYLRELRESFFEHTTKKSYSNIETVDRFSEFYNIVQRSRITYEVCLDKHLIQSLLLMTPLTWSVSNEQVQSFVQRGPTKITVDLELLVGTN